MKYSYIFAVFCLLIHQQPHCLTTAQAMRVGYFRIPPLYRMGALLTLSGLEVYALYQAYSTLQTAQRHARTSSLSNKERITAYLEVQRLQSRLRLLGGIFALPLIGMLAMELSKLQQVTPKDPRGNPSASPTEQRHTSRPTAPGTKPLPPSYCGKRGRDIDGMSMRRAAALGIPY